MGEVKNRVSIAYVRGWLVTKERDAGAISISRQGAFARPDEGDVVLRIEQDGLYVPAPDGDWTLIGGHDAAEGLQQLLLNGQNILGRHGWERMRMWEQLFLRLVEVDPDVSPHHAAHRALKCLEQWELARKAMGLPHLSEEKGDS